MRRFGHGHSLAAGVILTLSLERNHALLALSLVFTCGVLCGLGWQRGRRIAAAAARWQAERLVELRSRVRYRRRSKAEQAREVKRAYIDGAIDGSRS